MSETQIINGCEVFLDPCFYDMWAVRVEGCLEFDKTLHFPKQQEAQHAAQTLGSAISAAVKAERERCAGIVEAEVNAERERCSRIVKAVVSAIRS